MRWLFFLLGWLAWPLYVLLGVVIVYQAWRWLKAQDDLRSTFFELERDLARNRRAGAITGILISLEIAVLLVGVQVRAVPYLESERDLDEMVAQQSVQDVVDGDFRTPTLAPISDIGLDLEIPPPLDGVSESGFIPT